jgi:hypothetical protein
LQNAPHVIENTPEATFTDATNFVVPYLTDHISQATAGLSAVTIGGSTYGAEL